MFVFVCSAYIEVPICVLAGGSEGKRTGEVRWGGGVVGLALVLLCFSV